MILFRSKSKEVHESYFITRYTEAELQQALLGLKRSHKEAIEQMRKEQDEALFKVRTRPKQSPRQEIPSVSDVSGTVCLKGGCKWRQ